MPFLPPNQQRQSTEGRNLPKKFRLDPSTFYLVIVVTNRQMDRQTNAGDSIIPRFRRDNHKSQASYQINYNNSSYTVSMTMKAATTIILWPSYMWHVWCSQHPSYQLMDFMGAKFYCVHDWWKQRVKKLEAVEWLAQHEAVIRDNDGT